MASLMTNKQVLVKQLLERLTVYLEFCESWEVNAEEKTQSQESGGCDSVTVINLKIRLPTHHQRLKSTFEIKVNE